MRRSSPGCKADGVPPDPMNGASRSTVGARVLVALGLWLAIATVLSTLGAWERIRIPMPVVVPALVGILLGVIALNARVRVWVYALDPRWLVALHLVRFVGFLFLVMYQRGELPWAFAVPGGWGDIVVGCTAAVLLVAVLPVRSRTSWRLLLIWNLAGLTDILFVVSTALRLFLSDPPSMSALLRLPLSLLPAFFVPLIIVSHLILFVWLKHHRGDGNSNAFADAPF